MIQRTSTTIASNISIIITAAGSSTRMGSGIKKEYLPLNNGTVISNCAKTFLKAIPKTLFIKHFIITLPKGMEKEAEGALMKDLEFANLLKEFPDLCVSYVQGGSTRQKSVFNGMQFIKDNGSTDIVLIHDGARPFVTEKIILDVINEVILSSAAVPGMMPTDTIKELDENGNITRHLVRKNLLAVQTPQGFDFQQLYKAHLEAKKVDFEYTDDTEIYGTYIGPVKAVSGDEKNIKITYPQDLKKL